MSRVRRTRVLDPLTLRIARLAERIDAIGEGEPPRLTWFEQIVETLSPEGGIEALPELASLSAALDRVGIRTVAEARLVRRLAPVSGRLSALKRGLDRRCAIACGELERAVRRAVHRSRIGSPIPGAARTLGAELSRLQRIARVTAVLSEQAHGDRPRSTGRSSSRSTGSALRTRRAEAPVRLALATGLPPPASPRLALALWLEARAATLLASGRRRRELRRASALLIGLDSSEDRKEALALRWRIAQQQAVEAADGPADPGGKGRQAQLGEVRRLAAQDPSAAWRELQGLYARAIHDGHPRLAEASQEAMEALVPDPGVLREALSQRLEEGEAEGLASHPDAGVRALAGRVPSQRLRLMKLARGCGRFFEFEARRALPVEADNAPRAPAPSRVVRWPTHQMEIDTTGDPGRAQDFVIEDPRRVLLELASHRQTVRTWREEVAVQALPPTRPSTVRVYVCDASGSMHGARARMRDALLIAELESILECAREGLPCDPLYYCYFDDRPTSLMRVDGPDDALLHLEQILRATPAAGPTDITLALTSALDAIAQARRVDAALSRASLVLVTDGEDQLELERIERARRPLEGLPISLSFVSLGRENPDLRGLARAHAAEGASASYEHLDDAELLWAHTAFETPFQVLLPEELELPAGPVSATPDHAEWERRLDALEQIAGDVDRGEQAFRPLPAPPGTFEHLFSATPPASRNPVPAATVEKVLQFLEALEATAALVPPEARSDECVQLLEHLCGVYGLSAADWLAALAAAGERSRAPLRRLRLLAHPLSA